MVIMILLCLLIAIIFGGSYYAYRYCFYASPKGRDKTPSADSPQYAPYLDTIRHLFRQLQDRPCEYVTIRSIDGLTLSGRYFHVKDGAPLDICFHGYRSSAITDFCGGSELSFQLEHNLLLIDERAHGKSQGNTITFGIKERYDLLCWVNYTVERFGSNLKIALYGVSMGAATVLMASSLPLPENVKCIVADCPYSSPSDIILTVGKTLGYPPRLIWPFVVMGAKLFGRFDIRETTAADCVRHAKVPILIIHGEADGLVPCEMSDAIASANTALIQRSTFPGARHAISYLVDTKRYQEIVTAFIKEHI